MLPTHRPAIRRSLTAVALTTLLALGSLSPSFAHSTATVASSATSQVSVGQAAADRALAQVGASYVWGATGPNAFDCSGLTSTSWQAAGVTIPRTARAQASALNSVSRANLRPGDLVFFNRPVSHVAMYVGDNKIVEASRSRGAVRVSSLEYRTGIVGYGRP